MKKHSALDYVRYGAKWSAGIATWWARALPDYVIIGAQKCGTTSLYNYLIKHPQVLPALRKEVHYFDLHASRGLWWYRSHFPTQDALARLAEREGRAVTGESSPYYIFHPDVPARFAATLPDTKVIVLLRDPVERAYSHYHHERRRGNEQRSFAQAVSDELKSLSEGGPVDERAHHRFSYIQRGQYAEQIERWRQYVPAERMLVMRGEDLFETPAEVLARAQSFLGLRIVTQQSYPVFNASGGYEPIAPDVQARLAEYFAPWNARLAELTGIRLAEV